MIRIADRLTRTRAVLAAVLMLATAPASAAELVMFERDGCPYCARFNREIAPIYARTDEGKVALLRRVDIHAPIPPDLKFIAIERITPVFVLVEHGREVGRIRGYPGDENFWGLLAGLIEELHGTGGAVLH